MTPEKLLATAAISAAIITSGAHVAVAGALEITITDVRSGKGNLRVALHNSSATFPSGGAPFKRASAKAAKGNVVVTFKDVPPGKYALSIYHDENANEKLDKNLIGLPTEGYGFSNDARGTFGPPKFKAATFEVSRPNARLAAKMAY